VSSRSVVKGVFARAGYQLVRTDRQEIEYPPDFTTEDVELCDAVTGWTLTSPERIIALRDAVQYVIRADIPGAFVECGVWRGGSMQVIARTLAEIGAMDRELYLFDTFEYMPAPTERDVDAWGRPALDDWRRYEAEGESAADPAFWFKPFEEVKSKLYGCGYPDHRFHFVKGLIEDTIPDQAPESIALLRLDTDWYESTKHELEHLVPRMLPGSVVIIDDYGHFHGARDAVDEYLDASGLVVLLHRLDYSGRLIVLPAKQEG
jgi:O-methyltransferase